MIFEATANNGIRNIKENLDSFIELQEFMNKMQLRGFCQVSVKASKSNGATKLVCYNWNGLEWEK